MEVDVIRKILSHLSSKIRDNDEWVLTTIQKMMTTDEEITALSKNITSQIMAELENIAKTERNFTACIFGMPGTGKSVLAMSLAQLLNIMYARQGIQSCVEPSWSWEETRDILVKNANNTNPFIIVQDESERYVGAGSRVLLTSIKNVLSIIRQRRVSWILISQHPYNLPIMLNMKPYGWCECDGNNYTRAIVYRDFNAGAIGYAVIPADLGLQYIKSEFYLERKQQAITRAMMEGGHKKVESLEINEMREIAEDIAEKYVKNFDCKPSSSIILYFLRDYNLDDITKRAVVSLVKELVREKILEKEADNFRAKLKHIANFDKLKEVEEIEKRIKDFDLDIEEIKTEDELFNYLWKRAVEYIRQNSSTPTSYNTRMLYFFSLAKNNKEIAKIMNISPDTVSDELKAWSGAFYRRLGAVTEEALYYLLKNNGYLVRMGGQQYQPDIITDSPEKMVISVKAIWHINEKLISDIKGKDLRPEREYAKKYNVIPKCYVLVVPLRKILIYDIPMEGDLVVSIPI